MLLRSIAKDMTSSLLSWHKRYDFNAATFRRHTNENVCYERNELEWLNNVHAYTNFFLLLFLYANFGNKLKICKFIYSLHADYSSHPYRLCCCCKIKKFKWINDHISHK